MGPNSFLFVDRDRVSLSAAQAGCVCNPPTFLPQPPQHCDDKHALCSIYTLFLISWVPKVGAYMHELATELRRNSERVAIPACANRLISGWVVDLLGCAC